jgi:hypothetical protein
MKIVFVLLMALVSYTEGVRSLVQSAAMAAPLVTGLIKNRHDLERSCKAINQKGEKPKIRCCNAISQKGDKPKIPPVISKPEIAKRVSSEEFRLLCLFMDK